MVGVGSPLQRRPAGEAAAPAVPFPAPPNMKETRMRPDAVRAAPSVGSRKTLHIFRIASTEDIPDATTHYERLVERGEINPAARAMFIAANGYRGALSPPQGPTAVHDVKDHVVGSEAARRAQP
jgi:hypothetical protein